MGLFGVVRGPGAEGHRPQHRQTRGQAVLATAPLRAQPLAVFSHVFDIVLAVNQVLFVLGLGVLHGVDIEFEEMFWYGVVQTVEVLADFIKGRKLFTQRTAVLGTWISVL